MNNRQSNARIEEDERLHAEQIWIQQNIKVRQKWRASDLNWDRRRWVEGYNRVDKSSGKTLQVWEKQQVNEKPNRDVVRK